MKSEPPQSLPRVVELVFAAAVAAYLGCTVWLVWRTAILEPYSDMYDWIARWRRLQADGDLGRYLWAPHNFHHLAWTFTILDLDIGVFGARSYLFLAVGVLCLVANAAMLAGVAAAAAGRGLRLVGAGGAAALATMGCYVLDANADINTTYLHALVLAVGAILLAEGPGPRPTVRRAGALACALAAGLGNAAGLAVWPALLFAAWRAGRWGWMLTVLTMGAAFGGIYLVGQNGTVDGGSKALGEHLADAVALSIQYLALPWARAAVAAGWSAGLAVLAVALAAVVCKGRRGAAWPERVAVSLILFSLGTAVMAGAGRTGLITPDMVPMRYAVFLIPLHVGLWILALPYLRRAWERRPTPMAGAVAASAALMLVHQGAMAVFAVRTADTNLRVIADFRSGERSASMLATIYSDLDVAQALAARMRREGLYQAELRPDPPEIPNGSDSGASSTGP